MNFETITIPATSTAPLSRPREITPSLWEMIQSIAPVIHQSRLFNVASPEQAASIMLKGHELGLSLAASFELIHNIRGQVGLSPRGAMALIHRSQLIDVTIEDKPGVCTVTMKRRDTGFTYSCTFSIEDARRAGLIKPDSGWEKWEPNMLRWRAIGFCADVACPDLLAGMKTADQYGAIIDRQGNIVEAEVQYE
jgi:hypothetical protein